MNTKDPIRTFLPKALQLLRKNADKPPDGTR